MVNDLVAGHVDLLFIQLDAVRELWRAGKLKMLAVASDKRLDELPGIPDIAEAGVPDLRVDTWNAIAAPPKTPKPIIAKINAAMNEVFALPEIRARLATMSMQPAGGTPADMAAFVKAETRRWGDVIQAAHITVELARIRSRDLVYRALPPDLSRTSAMSDLTALIRDLVVANRILAAENVVDAYGHVSVRHPTRPDRFLIASSLAPELVGEQDIMEFNLDCTPVASDGRPLYHERFIHGGIYEARPDVQAVVHAHSEDVLPFTIAQDAAAPGDPLGQLHRAARAGVGHRRPVRPDTNMLVTNMEQARDLAACWAGTTSR